MTMKTALALTLSMGLVATAATAQTRSLRTLLRDDSTSLARIAVQAGDCATPATQCSLGRTLADGWDGGVAYVPARNTTWYSDGAELTEIAGSCGLACSVTPKLVLGRLSRIGGLAASPGLEELYQVESIAGRAAITTYSISAGCAVAGGSTTFTLPTPFHRAGAIAYDGARQHLWVASSAFWIGGAANVLYLFERTRTGWSQLCTAPVDSCSRPAVGQIQGMAFEACRRVLWIADAGRVYEQSVSYRTPCPTLTSLGCCGSPGGEACHGLDVELGQVQSVGSSCTSRGCVSCPNMVLAVRGRPVVGNKAVQLQVLNGPTGGTGFAMLNGGPCRGVPFACGQLYPSLVTPWIVVPMGTLAGSRRCDGDAFFTFPIPNNYGLCGVELCAQGLVICPSLDLALTNGLNLLIEG
ncbi:MAG: hypothetical protein AAF628_12210 [Planctomycetota bacterium]